MIRWMAKLLTALIVLAIVTFGIWFWVSVTFAYSTGQRAGYIQKFSKRGWVVKTWEGELAMVNLPGAMPEVFRFSVRSPETAQKIQANMGRRVSLQYDEHRYIPLPIFGETNYFATDVRPVEDAVAPAPLPVANTPVAK